jgi:hypothetical protein
VTSVATESGPVTYQANVKAPPGYTVSVSPPAITLATGETAEFSLTVTSVGAPVGEWRSGSLAWESKGYSVSSPIAVKGRLFRAPAEVSGSGESGSATFDVAFGYTGPYTAGAHGLVAATVTTDNVLQDPDQSFSPGDVATGGANLHQFTLSGAAFFRIAMPPEATEASADLDIYVFDPSDNLVAASTGPGTDELVDLLLPADGTWTVYVHGWAAPGGDSDYNLWTWVVPVAAGGSLGIDSAPASATLGNVDPIVVSWSGLTSGSLADWYLGAVSHTGDGGLMGWTLINVDNRP